jgi:phage shock protein C
MNTPPYRRLYRSRRDRKIAGVCGGLADFFGIDPTWVRLLFILFFFLGGSALLIYIIMWVIVPLEP